jgi:hypothetical protein
MEFSHDNNIWLARSRGFKVEKVKIVAKWVMLVCLLYI